jgi:uncharacterized membrane protein YeaQ/YmgE (transglycosylase-associated protein family)
MVTRDAPSWSTLLGLGATTALFLVIGLAAGWVADRFLHTLPVCTLVGLVLGIAGAARYTYVEFHKFYKD